MFLFLNIYLFYIKVMYNNNINKLPKIMTTTTNVKYEVYYNGYICKNPQYTVGYYSTIKRARNKATKLDLEYGGSAYNVRRVDATTLRPIRDEVA